MEAKEGVRLEASTEEEKSVHAVDSGSMDDKANLEGEGGKISAMEEDEQISSMDAGDMAMLMETAQLKRLGLVLRNNEETLMMRVITSHHDRAQYLKNVNDCYYNSVELLEKCDEMKEKHSRAGGVKSRIAHDVDDYVKYGLNLCMQNIRNCCMRVDTINKMKEHYDSLAEELDNAGADVEELAAEASGYKSSMWEYTYQFRSASGRARSRAYSRGLILEGITFPSLVLRHQVKLGYHTKGKFEDLDDTEKLEVYNSIIIESGRAQVSPVPRQMSRVKAKTWKAGVLVFLEAAGTMVWDVYTTEHKLEAVLSGSLNVMAAVGGFAVEVAVVGAVTKVVVNAGLGKVAVAIAGFVAGAVTGLIFAAVSGALIALILGTGGTTVPPVSELKFHTAKMPDGMAFANSIAHQSSS